jgi:hypothetical protein
MGLINQKDMDEASEVIRALAEEKSTEFMSRLINGSPMHKGDNKVFDIARLNYKNGFIAGALAQHEINKAAMYTYDEVVEITANLSLFVLDRQQGRTKMTAAEWLLSIKK